MNGKLNPTDEELMLEISFGCQSAYNVLFTRYIQIAYDYSKSVSCYNTRDPNIAYEIVHITWMKLLESCKDIQLTATGSFKALLFITIRNTAIDFFRKRNNFEKKKDVNIDVDNIQDSNESNVYELLQKEEEAKMIKNALKKLPHEQAEAVRLYIYGEFSLKEISMITGCSEGTSKYRYFTGVKKLVNFVQLKLRGEMFNEKNRQKC